MLRFRSKQLPASFCGFLGSCVQPEQNEFDGLVTLSARPCYGIKVRGIRFSLCAFVTPARSVLCEPKCSLTISLLGEGSNLSNAWPCVCAVHFCSLSVSILSKLEEHTKFFFVDIYCFTVMPSQPSMRCFHHLFSLALDFSDLSAALLPSIPMWTETLYIHLVSVNITTNSRFMEDVVNSVIVGLFTRDYHV